MVIKILLKKVEIKNLYGLYNVKLDNLGIFNVIIGKNRSGKSSILKLLLNYNFKEDEFWPKNIKVQSKDKIFRFKWNFDLNEISKVLKPFIERGMYSSTWRMLEESGENEFLIELINKNNVRDGNFYRISNPEKPIKHIGNELCDKIFEYIYKNKAPILIPTLRYTLENVEKRLTIKQMEKNKSDIQHIFYKNRDKLEIKNLFNLIFQEKLNDSEKFNEFRNLIKNLIQVDIDIVENEGEELEVVLNYMEDEYEFKGDFLSLGSGSQQLIIILLFCFFTENRIILIDEPEIGLHTGLQKKLFYTLVELAKRNNNQIFIATHSPIYIDLCDSIHLLENTEKGSISRPELSEKKRVILNALGVPLWGYLFSKGVIFAEGPTDCKYLRMYADKLGGDSDMFVFKYLGGYDRYHLVKEDIFDIPHFLILDRHTHTEDKIDRIRKEVTEGSVHILKFYEIENYLIDFNVIARLIIKKLRAGNEQDVIDDLKLKFKEICNYYKLQLMKKYLKNQINEQFVMKRSKIESVIEKIQDIAEAINVIKERMREKIKNGIDFDGILQIIEKKVNLEKISDLIEYYPGKEILKRIRKYISENYKVEITNEDILNEMNVNEIHPDIILLFKKISRKCSGITETGTEYLHEFSDRVEKNTKKFFNFLMYTDYFLDTLKIPFKDVDKNREEFFVELERKYQNDDNLIKVIKKSIKLWDFYFPPISRAELAVEWKQMSDKYGIILDPEVIYSTEEAPLLIEDVQEFLSPPPSLCKKLLLIEHPIPILNEINDKFFTELGKAEKTNRNEVLAVFQKAVKSLNESTHNNGYLFHSRFSKILFGNGFNFIERAKRIINWRTVLSKLDLPERKLIGRELIGLFDDLLEKSIKILFGVILNLAQISHAKKNRPINKTLEYYTRKLNFKNKEFIQIRKSFIQKNFQILFDKETLTDFVIFRIRERNRGLTTSITWQFNELFSRIITLNAFTNIYQFFMESYFIKYDKRK